MSARTFLEEKGPSFSYCQAQINGSHESARIDAEERERPFRKEVCGDCSLGRSAISYDLTPEVGSVRSTTGGRTASGERS